MRHVFFIFALACLACACDSEGSTSGSETNSSGSQATSSGQGGAGSTTGVGAGSSVGGSGGSSTSVGGSGAGGAGGGVAARRNTAPHQLSSAANLVESDTYSLHFQLGGPPLRAAVRGDEYDMESAAPVVAP